MYLSDTKMCACPVMGRHTGIIGPGSSEKTLGTLGILEVQGQGHAGSELTAVARLDGLH